MTLAALIANTALTHACVIRPTQGEWEYALWAIGAGHLTNAHTTLPTP